MASHESNESETRFDLSSAHHPHPRQQRSTHVGSPTGENDDLGASASNKAVTITLVVGIGLMVLVLMLPYLGSG